jgi:hypothetical protein
VEEIVQPYFEFHDFYKGTEVIENIPRIMPKLFFKLISDRPRPLIGKRKEKEIVDKLKSRNIGTVTVGSEHYIIIEVKKGSG